MRTIRVFVSSPGDALHERRRLERVVERLNGTFIDQVQLTTVRWETGFYAAHKTFQAQIPEAADCDIVVAIFRTRLGTALPAGFPTMANGEPYPSGTAYEILSAIEARKSRDLPDVFVFRHPFPPSVILDDPEGEEAVRAQWARLKTFFERWFVAPDGQFKAAFQTYDDVDRFEEQVDALLRGWLEEHVLGAGAVIWPVALKGSPFRGLEVFGAKHASVFFGRSRDTERAVDALKDAASHQGLPFLLLIGPSGSGKSSLARAGLLPRLTASGVVPEVDTWRSAVLRPTEVRGDAFMSLATRLFDDVADIPSVESGRPKALPELRDGDHATPRELADLLGHADDSALKPILRALDRVTAQEQKALGSPRPVQARLLLVVDQLDELLTPDADIEARERFGRLMALLAGTGRVWIVATLRADLYELYSASPELLALKKRGASYDVEPPGAAALEEIVRKPAAAAGLVFDERTLSDGKRQRLDERLIGDAERPDMLPMIEFTLNRLYEERESSSDGETMLSHAAYDRLGGLDGAIAQEAERSLAELGEFGRDRLPRLLRQLVVGSDGTVGSHAAARAAIRSVAYDEVARDEPGRALVGSLIAARILLGEGGTGADSRRVRLAHQRVLEAWPRARAIVAANARFFRIKPELERAEARWRDHGKPSNLLLPRGVALSEAEEIARTFGEELAPATRTYIQASSRRARLTLRLAVGAAAIFALVAASAGVATYQAYQAEQQAKAARDTLRVANRELRDRESLALRRQIETTANIGRQIMVEVAIQDVFATIAHQQEQAIEVTEELISEQIRLTEMVHDEVVRNGLRRQAHSMRQVTAASKAVRSTLVRFIDRQPAKIASLEMLYLRNVASAAAITDESRVAEETEVVEQDLQTQSTGGVLIATTRLVNRHVVAAIRGLLPTVEQVDKDLRALLTESPSAIVPR